LVLKHKMKILTILGARPQFIKAGTLSREILKHTNIDEYIVHTGQHYDVNMSDVFFNEMHIPKPHYFLNINGISHGAMTGQMMEKIEEIALNLQPDWIVVYGDTNSTLAGALVASKLHIKLAHIEAGLRSFNMKMPEEINRILTDRVSNLLFCPTQSAVDNLLEEGYQNFNVKICKSGDVMYDGAMFYKTLAKKPSFDLKKDFILSSVHRAENTDDKTRLKEIFEALCELSQTVQVVLPLHPRTKQKIKSLNIDVTPLTIVEPVGYLEMIWLLQHTRCIVSDSGGIQKEAFFFQKECIILRDETEWVELVDLGVNHIVGANKKQILSSVQKAMKRKYPQLDVQPYGEAKSASIIIKELLKYE